jgi:hypothetical protein
LRCHTTRPRERGLTGPRNQRVGFYQPFTSRASGRPGRPAG